MIKARPNVDSEQIKQLFLMIKYTFVLINVKINRTVYHLERCVKKTKFDPELSSKICLRKALIKHKNACTLLVANVFLMKTTNVIKIKLDKTR